MIFTKAWGTTRPIFDENNVELHRAAPLKGGFSSKHRHYHKFNLFYVESGKIMVEVWEEGLATSTIVEEGYSTTVEPRLWHRFTALEDSVVYEIYWVKLDKNDIQREDIGGVHASE